MFKNLYRIKIKGLNLEKLINFINQNYKIYNLVRNEYDEIILDLDYKSYENLILKTKSSCYNISIIKVFGIKNLLNNLNQYIALIISLIFSISFVIILNTKILNIKIYGVNDKLKLQINNVLKLNNIKKLSSKNVAIHKLENEMLENIDELSLVSIVVKGNTLIINAKQKMQILNNKYIDFVAPYNLIINNIKCFQGTKLKNNNDLVKKGEPIIGAYELDFMGNKKSIEPIFEIEATTYISSSIKFEENEIKLVRSGKKIINSCYNMFGNDFFFIKNKNNFKKFQEVNNENEYFKNLFLPIIIKKQIFYELKEINIKHNFDSEKEFYLQKSKNEAFAKIPKGLKVSKFQQEIIELKNFKLIQTYLDVKVKLKND